MYHFRKNKLLFFVSILFLISGFIFSSNLSALNIYKTGEFSLGFRVSRTPSTDVPAKINEALEILTPEAIAGVESQAKFIIHSGPSAVGQGTVKSTVVEKYSGENSGEIKFKKFLLYATRAKRGIKISENDIRYGIVKKYVEMVETQKNPSNIEEIISVMTDKEQNEKEKFTAENKEKLKELEGALFPNWTKMLSVVSRNDIPKLEERIKFQTAEEGKTNMVMVYQEFDGVHYYFRDSVEEVKK